MTRLHITVDLPGPEYPGDVNPHWLAQECLDKAGLLPGNRVVGWWEEDGPTITTCNDDMVVGPPLAAWALDEPVQLVIHVDIADMMRAKPSHWTAIQFDEVLSQIRTFITAAKDTE